MRSLPEELFGVVAEVFAFVYQLDQTEIRKIRKKWVKGGHIFDTLIQLKGKQIFFDSVIGGWEMNIHEYQGKEILRKYGVAVPNGKVAFTVEEAVEAAKELGTDVCVVKAQIHAGGRGKAGGVKVAKNLDEVRTYAE